MDHRTRIKMCGLTRLKDVTAGIEAGLDALGFVFYKKSPRNIEPDFVRDIIKKMPPFIDCVGVFVNRELDEVAEIVKYCGLSHAQLHGTESPKFCERIERFASPCRVIKAFRVGDDSKREEFSPYNEVTHGFLLDTYVKGNAGGTGETFNWEIIQQLHLQRPLILAGGLTLDNIDAALSSVRPFAVDVNSGVESEPGIKDYQKIQEFVRKIRQFAARNLRFPSKQL